MLNQSNGGAAIGSMAGGGNTAPGSPAVSPEQVMSAREGAPMEQPANPSPPRRDRSSGTRTLQAYIERRERLANRIKAEHPYYTDVEIEHRLEQFGA